MNNNEYKLNHQKSQDLDFSVYWKNGQFEVIKGPTLEQALIDSGCGPDKAARITGFDFGSKQTKWWCSKDQDWTLTNQPKATSF